MESSFNSKKKTLPDCHNFSRQICCMRQELGKTQNPFPLMVTKKATDATFAWVKYRRAIRVKFEGIAGGRVPGNVKRVENGGVVQTRKRANSKIFRDKKEGMRQTILGSISNVSGRVFDAVVSFEPKSPACKREKSTPRGRRIEVVRRRAICR